MLRRPSAAAPPAVVAELGPGDRDDLLALVDTDPMVNAVLAARLREVPGLDPGRLGGAVLGVRDEYGTLTAALFHGGNLVPVGGDGPAWAALAARVLTHQRRCTSLVGHVDAVTAMWRALAPEWGPPRTVRLEQPLLALDRDPGPAPSSAVSPVRAIRATELDAYLPAAAAMFTEELGLPPETGVGAGGYRARVAALVRAGRALGVVDRFGEVLFKADLGVVSPHTCQVQGVWVRPDLRGKGLGTAAMAGVLHHALTLAPTVSLYVNVFNTPARRMYAGLGLRQVATLSTVLL